MRDAVDFIELVSARTELRRAGPARYEGLCPFHDERTPSFGIDPVAEGLPLLRLPGLGRCVHVRAGDRGRRLQRRAGAAGGPLRRRARARGRRTRARPSGAAPRAAARAARRARPPTTSATCGSPSEAARAREYLAGAGPGGGDPAGVPRRIRPERLGPGAARPRAAAGFSEQELYATGLAQRSKENGRPYDRFRSRIMFPLADVRGRVLGFGARRDARGAAAEVPQHLRERRLPQGHAPLRRRSRAGSCRAGRAGDPVRGLHRRDRAAPGRHPQHGRV